MESFWKVHLAQESSQIQQGDSRDIVPGRVVSFPDAKLTQGANLATKSFRSEQYVRCFEYLRTADKEKK